MFGAWHFSGPTAAALITSVCGAFLARPLLDIGIDVRRRVRDHTLRGQAVLHLAFAKAPPDVYDDGRHAWVSAAGLKRLLRHEEPDDVFAARFAGRWLHRPPRATWFIRADAVLAHT